MLLLIVGVHGKVASRRRKVPKVVGLKGMWDEGFQEEMVELRVEINHVKLLLQKSQDD